MLTKVVVLFGCVVVFWLGTIVYYAVKSFIEVFGWSMRLP